MENLTLSSETINIIKQIVISDDELNKCIVELKDKIEYINQQVKVMEFYPYHLRYFTDNEHMRILEKRRTSIIKVLTDINEVLAELRNWRI